VDICKERVVLIFSLSLSLSSYIMARRLPNKVPNNLDPSFNSPNLDSDAKSIVDVRPTSRTEQNLVESGDEEIGSSAHKIGSNLLQQGIGRPSNKGETTTTEFTGAKQGIGRPSNTDNVPGDFENLLEFFVKQS
jgi:hypothetical protein